MGQSTNTLKRVQARPGKKWLTWHNTGVAALFLYGTTFLWLTAAFAGTPKPPAGTAWSITNVLVVATILGFTVAAWGVYKVTSWWERLAIGSAVFGFAPLIPYWVAAHAVSGAGTAAYVIGIHVVGNAMVLLLLLVPSLEHWVPRAPLSRQGLTGSFLGEEGALTERRNRTMERRIGHGILDALSGLPLFATAPLYRHWHQRWGATDEEVRGSMPGDEIVPKASFNATRAITIDAPPEVVWPWIVQMGYRRAGFYTYAILDNAGYESADHILEQYQPPKIGDWVPMAKKVNDTTAFKVKAFEINEWLLWEKPDSTWAWKLIPLHGGRTRLISRLKARYVWEKPGMAIFTLVLLEFGDFPMMRRVLKGIKVRAERERRTAGREGEEGVASPLIVAKRGRVAVIEADADIRHSPEEVFDYCSDPEHEPEWNIRMKRIQKLTDGPVGIGARYRMEFTAGPPAIGEVVRFERPRSWQLVGGSRVLRSGWTGRVLPYGDGAHLVLRMEVQLRGPLAPALPLVRRRMESELKRDIATIKATLEGAESWHTPDLSLGPAAALSIRGSRTGERRERASP